VPGGLVDRFDGGADGLDHPNSDRVLPARLLETLEDLGVPKPRVGPEQLDAGRAGAVDAGDQLVAKALDPLLRVRRTLPKTDVQRFARVGARRENWEVAQQMRIPVGGALLQPPADLPDEAVDIDDRVRELLADALALLRAGQLSDCFHVEISRAVPSMLRGLVMAT
jgi:hypothetical protein